MTKHLITFGNSITAGDEFPDKDSCDIHDTSEYAWPELLGKAIDYTVYNCGKSGNSNDGIARNVIEEVERLIKEDVDTNDLLVGIMWTDFSRWEMRIKNTDSFFTLGPWIIDLYDRFTEISKTSDWRAYVQMGKRALKSAIDYRYYTMTDDDHTDTLLATVHRIQLYLDSKNIKYFMNFTGTSYLTLGGPNQLFIHSAKHKQGLDIINWDKFYDMSVGMSEEDKKLGYVDANDMSRFFSIENVAHLHNTGHHPGHHPKEKAHEIFIDQYLVPTLKRNNVI